MCVCGGGGGAQAGREGEMEGGRERGREGEREDRRSEVRVYLEHTQQSHMFNHCTIHSILYTYSSTIAIDITLPLCY